MDMLEEVKNAYARVGKVANRTPVMTSRTLDDLTKSRVFVKCENFQRGGAFKFRGAFNAMALLTEDEQRRGVITHSSGNHGQAVALAGKLLGVKATVVMPSNSSRVKKDAVRDYGAEIIECGSTPADRKETTEKLIKDHGYHLVHPSNDMNVIFGAGTVAYEMLDQVGSLDVVMAPVGGGGLLSGTSIAVKGMCPSACVLGVEPKNADDAYRSMKAGRIIPSDNPRTIADGLRTSLGENTFAIIRSHVDDIITVTEEQIISAMRFLLERMKLVVEPSGAVALAGLLTESLDTDGKKVGIIVSGGNIDLNGFFSFLEASL